MLDLSMLNPETPQWERFMGNNHEWLEVRERRGGGVNIAYHWGKPLTDELWIDLTMRLGLHRLRIYRGEQAAWTDTFTDGAIISLTKEGRVVDIVIYPRL